MGDNRVRTQGAQDGQQFVQIADNAKGVSYILVPDQRSYMEMRVPAAAPLPQGKPADPCANLQGVTCRKAGSEAIGGRAATRWEMTSLAGNVREWTASESTSLDESLASLNTVLHLDDKTIYYPVCAWRSLDQ